MKNTPYKKEFNNLGELVNPITSYSERGYINNFLNRNQRRAKARAAQSKGQYNNRSGNRINIVSTIDETGKPIFFKMKKIIQRIGEKIILHNIVIN